ncbi:MAG TPA: BMC domain-containing protein [Desulfosporosinus sp.]|nr:BMC domain-containing protein [Desulfosporosinus sp.]
MPQFRIISAPSAGIKEMLLRKANAQSQVKEMILRDCTAIGMFQASVADCYYYADLAQKAGDVVALEISGSCPQRISMIALFGDISAVQAAVKAISNDAGGVD